MKNINVRVRCAEAAGVDIQMAFTSIEEARNYLDPIMTGCEADLKFPVRVVNGIEIREHVIRKSGFNIHVQISVS